MCSSDLAPARPRSVPELAATVGAERLVVPAGLSLSGYDVAAAGGERRWGDYAVGERIDHIAGVTVEEAEHQIAARLYNNSAHAHFDRRRAGGTAFGRRLVYSGHIMSLTRALTFEGFSNAFRIAAVNAARSVTPVGGGDTLYAWSEVLERIELAGRRDMGALRLRTVTARDSDCREFPRLNADGTDHPAVAFELDYTVLVPR